MRKCLLGYLLPRWLRDLFAKPCGALMQTQSNFEIEFQELEFKNSVKIKIKERKASLFVYYY